MIALTGDHAAAAGRDGRRTAGVELPHRVVGAVVSGRRRLVVRMDRHLTAAAAADRAVPTEVAVSAGQVAGGQRRPVHARHRAAGRIEAALVEVRVVHPVLFSSLLLPDERAEGKLEYRNNVYSLRT